MLEERGFNKEEDLEKLLAQILENPSKNPEIIKLWNHLLKKDSIPESGDSDLESLNNDHHFDESSGDEGFGKI